MTCGLPGAVIRHVAESAHFTLHTIRPSAIIIQVGINNLFVPLDDPQWLTLDEDLGRLFDAAMAHAGIVIVTTPFPIEKGFDEPDSSVLLRAQWLAEEVVPAIFRQAATRSLPIIDLFREFSTDDGTAKPGTTVDGIHFSAEATVGVRALYEARLLNLSRSSTGDLGAAIDLACAQLDAARNDFDCLRAILPQSRKATYESSDGFTVWERATDPFLEDPKFKRAYAKGNATGHRFGDPKNLHIEWRVLVGCWAAYHCRLIEGDFVECGVNTGILANAIEEYIDFNNISKDFFLFDTFNGIPVEQAAPGEIEHAQSMNDAFYWDCFDIAQKNFSHMPRARLVRGVVPESLSTVQIDKVAFLSLDMNIAAPELAALEYFWDRLTPSAIVLFDDYAYGAVQREEMNRFAISKNTSILPLPTGQGLLIKPFI